MSYFYLTDIKQDWNHLPMKIFYIYCPKESDYAQIIPVSQSY